MINLIFYLIIYKTVSASICGCIYFLVYVCDSDSKMYSDHMDTFMKEKNVTYEDIYGKHEINFWDRLFE